jgi:hypothetical protein
VEKIEMDYRFSFIVLLMLGISCPTLAQDKNEAIRRAQDAVREKLKDPSSAQFKDVAYFQSGSLDVVCGQVNAKNAYGGYSGFREFLALNKVALIRMGFNRKIFDEAWDHFCR